MRRWSLALSAYDFISARVFLHRPLDAYKVCSITVSSAAYDTLLLADTTHTSIYCWYIHSGCASQ